MKNGYTPWNKGLPVWNKGIPHSEEHKRKISEGNKGRIVSQETRRKISLAHKGKKCPWSTGKQNLGRKMTGRRQIGWKLSKKSRINISKGHIGINTWMKGKKLSEEWKRKIRKAVKQRVEEGLHNFWKGGISQKNRTERMNIMSSFEYKLWRKSVFERDDFTCQKYGIKGGELIAHHINNFAEKEELRLAIDNGITLSKKAHKEFHKIYGVKNNTREQLQEFLVSG